MILQADAVTRDFTICNMRGLHARASAKFVQCAESFDAVVTVCKDCQCVGGTSIMGLMMLSAAKGSSVRISATGPEAETAINALEKLICERFGEDE